MGGIFHKILVQFLVSTSGISRYGISCDLRPTIFFSVLSSLLLKRTSANWNKHRKTSDMCFAMLGVCLSNTSWSSVRLFGIISLEIMSFMGCFTLLVCVRLCSKNSQNSIILALFCLIPTVQYGHTKSCEMFILEKSIFWTLDNMGCRKFQFLSISWRFSPLERLEIFRLRQNFMNYPRLTLENIYSSAEQAKSFRFAFHPDKFYREPCSRVYGTSCWRSNYSLLDRVSPWKESFPPPTSNGLSDNKLCYDSPRTAFPNINPVAHKLTTFGRVTSSVTSVSVDGRVDIGRSRQNHRCSAATNAHVS